MCEVTYTGILVTVMIAVYLPAGLIWMYYKYEEGLDGK